MDLFARPVLLNEEYYLQGMAMQIAMPLDVRSCLTVLTFSSCCVSFEDSRVDSEHGGEGGEEDEEMEEQPHDARLGGD